MYKIAFHLAKGANFQKWQIRDSSNEATYFCPDTHTIVLRGCRLHNQKGASLRIFNGGEKNRCAWIEFESYEIIAKSQVSEGTELSFNPRVCPTWVVNGKNADNSRFETIVTNGKKVYSVYQK